MKKKPLFIAFASQKGGVGKTAFTVLTAGILHYQRGYNVAVVDCDAPQHSISQMRGRDMERIGENDFLKISLYRQHEQLQKLAYPIIDSDPENALADFYSYADERGMEFDIVLFDLPGTLRSMGVIQTVASMNYIFIPLKADNIVMQSSLQFAAVIEEELVSRCNCDLKGIHLFWNMIDRRERKETYESWNKVMQASSLHLLNTRIPDTKRYNKELSAVQNGVFRSTLFPADNRQIKGSGLAELVDEICAITGLGKSPQPEIE